MTSVNVYIYYYIYLLIVHKFLIMKLPKSHKKPRFCLILGSFCIRIYEVGQLYTFTERGEKNGIEYIQRWHTSLRG